MSRLLKRLHYISLSLGFLSTAAVLFNLVIFFDPLPQVTQFLESQPRWESYGIVVAINIIVLAFFQLSSVISLLAYLIVQKKTSTMLVLAIVIGILSGIMILGDITLLSDIGNEYEAGLQTRGEWWILFASYGLHVLSLILGLVSLIKNLNQNLPLVEPPAKDEVLFLSLHTGGVICGVLGLVGVIAGLISNLSLWMMERLVVILSLIVLTPYMVTLLIWLFRRHLAKVSSCLDEKQFQDLTASGLRTLITILIAGVIFFALQLSTLARESWQVLWLPLEIFLSLAVFSGLSLIYSKIT